MQLEIIKCTAFASAADDLSVKLYNYGEGLYKGLLLIESTY